MPSQIGEAETPSHPDSDSPWPPWAANLRPRNLERKRELFSGFGKWLKKHAPWVWAGDLEVELSQSAQLQLREKLLESAQSAPDEVALSDWWDRLIAAGNRSGRWQIPLLPPIARLPLEKPSFVRRDFQLLRHYRAVQDALFEQICTGLPDAALADTVLCSAVFFGGLLSPKYIAAFMQVGVTSGFETGGRLSLILDASQSRGRYRRWYPDALTATLCVRVLARRHWHPDGQPANDKLTSEMLLASARRLGLPVGAFANGMELLRAARVAHALVIPAYLVAYQAGESESDSLPEAVIDHLNGWSSDNELQENPEKSRLSDTGPRDIPEHHSGIHHDLWATPVDQVRVISEAKVMLARDGKPAQALGGLLSKYSGSLWPITGALIGWAQWLLGHLPGEGAEYRRDAVRGVTVIRYLGAVARRLIEEAESEDVFSFDMEDFETLYELAALRVKRTSERAMYWGRIRSFHDYMYLHGAPELLIGELDGYIAGGERRVSANLTGERDYQSFREALKQSAGDERDVPFARLAVVAILGYRCGLRRREIQMLRAEDIFPGRNPCLIIRPSKLAELKTYAARRRIPLRALMPPDELQELMDFASRRSAELAGKPGLLLAEYATPLVPLSPALLFDPVTEAFSRLASYSAPRFKFHHLRHSFANWLLLALVAGDEQRLIDRRLKLFDAFLLRPSQISALREEFYPRLPGTLPMPERRHLYLVSVLLGHLSPETTLGSYIHVLDWLAARASDLALEWRLANLGSAGLGNVCGLSPSMPFKKPYRELLQQPAEFLLKFVSQKTQGLLAKKSTRPDEAIDLTAVFANLNQMPLPNPGRLFAALGCYCRKVPVEEIVKVYGTEGLLVASAYVAYRKMYAKQSVATEKRLLPQPSVPRTREASREFWRIIDATEAAFANPDNRHGMTLAAERLISRTGPRTGLVYFGDRQELAVDVVKGLMCMGLPPHVLKLDVRVPGIQQRTKPELIIAAEEIRKLGVIHEESLLAWPRRAMVGALLRLEITCLDVFKSGKKLSEKTGRIRGVNYAALWVQCAAKARSNSPPPSGTASASR